MEGVPQSVVLLKTVMLGLEPLGIKRFLICMVIEFVRLSLQLERGNHTHYVVTRLASQLKSLTTVEPFYNTIGNQHLVHYSKVSLSQVLPVYFQ